MSRRHHDSLTTAERRKLMQVQIRHNVATHGCHVMAVFPTKEHPGVPWAYSIGIPTTFPGAAEVIIAGLDPDTAHVIINTVVAAMRKGKTFADRQKARGIVKKQPLAFRKVAERYYDDYVGQGQIYHQSDSNWPLLQIIWPDTQGRFPWQEGFEERFRAQQPLLFDNGQD